MSANKSVAVLAYLVVTFGLGGSFVFAQVPSVSSVVAGCSSNCAQQVEAYVTAIQATGATQAEVDSALVALTEALGTAAQTAGPGARTQYATGIRVAAARASAGQRQALLDVAAAVTVGTDVPNTAASDT